MRFCCSMLRSPIKSPSHRAPRADAALLAVEHVPMISLSRATNSIIDDIIPHPLSSEVKAHRSMKSFSKSRSHHATVHGMSSLISEHGALSYCVSSDYSNATDFQCWFMICIVILSLLVVFILNCTVICGRRGSYCGMTVGMACTTGSHCNHCVHCFCTRWIMSCNSALQLR